MLHMFGMFLGASPKLTIALVFMIELFVVTTAQRLHG